MSYLNPFTLSRKFNMNLLFIEEAAEASNTDPSTTYSKKWCIFNGNDATSFSVSERGFYHKLVLPEFSRNVFGDLTIMTDVGDVLFKYHGKLKNKPVFRKINIAENIKIHDIVFCYIKDALCIRILGATPSDSKTYACLYSGIESLTIKGYDETSDEADSIHTIRLSDNPVSFTFVGGIVDYSKSIPDGKTSLTLECITHQWGLSSSFQTTINRISSIHGLFVELDDEFLATVGIK